MSKSAFLGVSLLVVVSLATVACSGSGSSATSSSASTMIAQQGVSQDLTPFPADVISPLIIADVAPDPVPVKGSDDQVHVAYELTVLNFAPRPATVTSVETLAPDGSVVTALTQEQVAARTMIVADYSTPQPVHSGERGDAPSTRIAAGKTALLVLDDVYASRETIPTSVTHRISATFGPAESGEGAIAVLWPDQVTQTGGPVTISTSQPVQIGAPLAGPGWFITAGCCTLNAHRNVLLPVGGRINGAERFAIDAVQVDAAEADRHGAVYYHLAPGSPTVKVGDKVAKGDVIARLGNSGNSSEAHLHFQLSRTPLIFSSDSVPYVFDEFTVVGSVDETTMSILHQPTPGPRRAELPLALTVVDFP